MKKMLAIVGPTGSGKTALAISLSKLFPSILISADSRQVFKGMDIVTGKDHPVGVELSGIDLVNPDQECSVSVWQKSISNSLSSTKLPIVVGGTGLYVQSLIKPFETISVKPNPVLRSELEQLSVADLRGRLKDLNSQKYLSMNNSDVNNPRRLIRAIEVAISNTPTALTASNAFTSLIIGLSFKNNLEYESKVRNRVLERIDNGAIEETRKLLEKYSPDLPSMTAIGYKHIIKFIKGDVSKDQLISEWTQDELAYAKRQMTFFNKMEGIHWFDPLDSDSSHRVEDLVKTWYYGA